jgi:hypothetical protein
LPAPVFRQPAPGARHYPDNQAVGRSSSNLPETNNFRQDNLSAYPGDHRSKSSIALRGNHAPRADERRCGTQHVSFCFLVHLVLYTASSIPKDVTARAKPFALSKPLKILELNRLS